LFKSPDFAEDTERSAFYAVCPAEKISHLVSSWTCILRNWRLKNIIMGNNRPENHEMKVHYSEMVKAEL
jgi:hypothetical protein